MEINNKKDIGEEILTKLRILELIIKNKFGNRENDKEYTIALSCGNRSLQ